MYRLLIPSLLLLACVSLAQNQKWQERMIPVRDGESLAADLYISDSTIKKPTILIQLPYNKNNFRLIISLPQGGGTEIPYDSAKYNYVIVDWRGFYGSKDAGIGKPTYDRGLDGFDIVEWIAAQSWSNGKIGTWGGSALGLIQFQTAKHHPPHLVCAMPFIMDYKTEYQKYFPGGVFMREHYERLQGLGLVGTAFILQHPTYDLTWKIAEANTDYPDSIDVPLLMVTGWFDHFPDGVIRAYEDLRKRSDPSVRDKHKLIIGPWLHTRIGLSDQGILSYPEAAGVPTDLAFQFFGYYLLGEETAWEASPAVRYFDLGNHTWNTTSLWSEVTTATQKQKFCMLESGKLSTICDPEQKSVSFDYNPRDPSPSIGSSIFSDTYKGQELLHGPQDISQSVEQRNDIVIFSTDPLTEDLTVRGTITVTLNVTTDNGRDTGDTDFAVRLCDVYPDGRSIIISDAIKRLRFRNGYEKEQVVASNTIQMITIDFRNLAMTFLKGHRLRLDITSSNFPRFDLNSNTGGVLYTAGDTVVAHNTLLLGGLLGSYAEIPLMTPLGVENRAAPIEQISLAPNPCLDMTVLKLHSEYDTWVTYDLYDLLGRIVSTDTKELLQGVNSLTISLDGLPPGSYYLRLRGHKTGFARVIKGLEP